MKIEVEEGFKPIEDNEMEFDDENEPSEFHLDT